MESYWKQTWYCIQYPVNASSESERKIHRIPCESYRDFNSLDAFFTDPRRKVKPRNKNDKFMYLRRFEDELEIEKASAQHLYEKFGVKNLLDEEIIHFTLDDFYNYIGYNRKTKKYN